MRLGVLRIHISQRFIQDEYLTVAQKTARQRQTLALAAGEVAPPFRHALLFLLKGRQTELSIISAVFVASAVSRRKGSPPPCR